MSSTSASTAAPRSHRRRVGAAATIASIAVYVAAGRLVGSDDPAAVAVLLCGVLSIAAVVGAASGLAVATARPEGAASPPDAAPGGRGAGRAGAATLVVGVALAAAYWVLRALGVADLGAPANIGGGMVQLVTYAVTAVGAFVFVAARR
ncbi:hypothetical protein [Cellulomonas sp. URHB0016]